MLKTTPKPLRGLSVPPWVYHGGWGERTEWTQWTNSAASGPGISSDRS